ncbi:AraC family transcriptional regulator [Halalkalibacterium halodurans]|uniref:HTH araC/xylS-type domain-containing protein n=1 Tax=Halalkalibacterium halodurans TaxID=86665 RepID=A0A0M0KN05_ALKHA|nr:AraC family transcriptional regulator [Halalkalibacterium halodurans]TPE67343.1 helix-turn-helix transcriptional regulator [Halalkalibacterium halodurans]
MDVDLNELAGQFASGFLTVDGVYRTTLEAGRVLGHTRAYPTPKSGFLFALKGEASFVFNGTAYHLSPGKVVHGGKNMELIVKVGPAAFEYCLIHYTLHTRSNHRNDTDSHFLLDPGENLAITEKLDLLHRIKSTPGNFPEIQAKALFYTIFHDMLICARNRLNRESQLVIEQVVEYIHHHYMEPMTVKKLADMSGMGVKPFSYLFKKYIGMFPIDYLIQYRLKRAKNLLVSSNSSIADIAESIGYLDALYFSRLFKKHIGCSPTAFRTQMGNCPSDDQ